MRCSRIPSTRSWTIPRKFRSFAAAVALAALVPLTAQATLQTDPNALTRTMKAAFDRGAANGWHFADDVYYFSTVLDAGRAYELVRRDDPDNLKLECRVNGETRQSSNTSDFIFNSRKMISYISRVITLKPGDIIFTGTPQGVIQGKPKDQQVWLKPGDKIACSLEKLGELKFELT